MISGQVGSFVQGQIVLAIFNKNKKIRRTTPGLSERFAQGFEIAPNQGL
jgi:hypothetical protein